LFLAGKLAHRGKFRGWQQSIDVKTFLKKVKKTITKDKENVTEKNI